LNGTDEEQDEGTNSDF